MKTLSLVIFIILLLSVPALCQRDVNSVSDKLFDLRMQHKYDEAIADLNKAIDLAPNDAMSYIERARFFNLVKNNEAVLKDVRTAVSLPPYKSGILNSGAKELFRSGQYEENIKIADDYIARGELIYLAYKIRSENKFALNDYAGAIEDSIKSIKSVSPTDDKGNYSLGRVGIGSMSLFDVIYPITNKYLKDDERIFKYYNQIFDVLEEKVKETVKDQQQQEFYKRLKPGEMVIFPEVNKLRTLMMDCAELYAEKGQPEKGVELYGRVVNLENQPAATYLGYSFRASYYQKLGLYQKAIDDLTFIISGKEIPHTIGLILMRRAALYRLTGQYDQAIADDEAATAFSKKVQADMKEKADAEKQKMP